MDFQLIHTSGKRRMDELIKHKVVFDPESDVSAEITNDFVIYQNSSIQSMTMKMFNSQLSIV